jgi:hypothetical protein
VAENGANAGELVAGDRLTGTAAADDDRILGVAVENAPADVLTEGRIVDDLVAHVGRPVVDLVAVGLQPGDQALLEGDAVVVGCD